MSNKVPIMMLGLFSIGAALGCASGPDQPASAAEQGAYLAAAQVQPEGSDVEVDDVPTCGDRMTMSVPWTTEIAFGSRVARASWLVEGESAAGFAEPPAASPFFWGGVTVSSEALTCGESPDACEAGGSRIELRDAAGKPLAVHVHWRPEELPAPPTGSRVRLTLSRWSGQLTMTTDDGALILGIVRYGGHAAAELRKWQFGPIHVVTGAPVCSAVNAMCRYRDVAQTIVVRAGGRDLTLAPTDEAQLDAGGVRYRVVNHLAVQRGIASPDGVACAAARSGLDAISVLRLP